MKGIVGSKTRTLLNSLVVFLMTCLSAHGFSSLSAEAVVAQARELAAAHPGWKIAIARGDSMEPVVTENCVVLYDRNGKRALQPSMIVVVRERQSMARLLQVVAVEDGGTVRVNALHRLGSGRTVPVSAVQGVLVGVLRVPESKEISGLSEVPRLLCAL